MNDRSGNYDSTRGTGGWTHTRSDLFGAPSYPPALSEFGTGPLTTTESFTAHHQLYVHPAQLTLRYPSPPCFPNTTELSYHTQFSGIAEHPTITYAEITRSSLPAEHNQNRTSSQRRLPVSSLQSIQTQQRYGSLQRPQTQQEIPGIITAQLSSAQLLHSPPVPQSTTYAQVAQLQFHQNVYARSHITAPGSVQNTNVGVQAYNLEPSQHLPSSYLDPQLRNPVNIDMRRQPPQTLLPTSEPPQSNSSHTQRAAEGADHVTSMDEWLSEQTIVGTRTGLAPNASLPPIASPKLLSPGPSIDASSVTSSTRRSKRDIMSGNGLYRCGFCSASFNARENQKKHESRVHDVTTRRYHCKVCDKGFTYPKDLRRHILTHSDRPPKYLCPRSECEFAVKGFNRNDHYKRHLITHSRPDSGIQMSRSTPSHVSSQI